MHFRDLSLSRSWAWPVAGLLLLATTGCVQRRDSPEALADRAGRAVAKLQALQPKLAKAGTPDAEQLSDQLAAVREGLATLPPPPRENAVDVATELAAPRNPFAVRCPEDGCWRLGIQGEVAAWRVKLRGGGSTIDDVGPIALGVAIALEKARPIDWRSEWSWGGELVITNQMRSGGQHIDLIGLRPIARLSIGLSDQVALTMRPIIELGQASIKLGSTPGGVLDRAGLYVGFGARVGARWQREAHDLTGEIGWRRTVFHGLASGLDYRVDAVGPEIAGGWAWRF